MGYIPSIWVLLFGMVGFIEDQKIDLVNPYMAIQ